MKSRRSSAHILVLWFTLGRIAMGGEPSSLPSAEKPAEGWWRWTFIMPDGSHVEPKAKLKQEGSVITGTSQPRAGLEAAITEGRIDGKQVSWSVVRQEEGHKTTTSYSGILEGDRIRGQVESDWSGQKQVYPWEAKRVPVTPGGKWKWSVSFGGGRRGGGTNAPGTQASAAGGGRGGGGGRFETRATLAWDGKRLTGKVTGFGPDIEIGHGRFEKGEVSFDVVRDFRGETTTTHFHGVLDGDTIQGSSESDFGGEIRKNEWVATRNPD